MVSVSACLYLLLLLVCACCHCCVNVLVNAAVSVVSADRVLATLRELLAIHLQMHSIFGMTFSKLRIRIYVERAYMHILRAVVSVVRSLGQQPAPCYSLPSTSSSCTPHPIFRTLSFPTEHNPWVQVAPLSGGRRLTVRFRPSKRALGKLNEGHPDAHDSPAVPQLRYPQEQSPLHCTSIILLFEGRTTSVEDA